MGAVTNNDLSRRREMTTADMTPASELAPSLALPWIAKLRYGILAGQVGFILIAVYGFRIELPIAWLALPLGLTAVSNLLLNRLALAFSPRKSLCVILTLDTVCLTAVLALSGGPSNPFSVLYLVQIALSAVVLSKGWTWMLGCLSAAGYGFLFLAHVRVSAWAGHQSEHDISLHLFGMWIAFGVGALLITIFIGEVSEALRRREQEVLSLQKRLARHERLASIATLAAGAAHELGTPLATIAVAARELEVRAKQVTNADNSDGPPLLDGASIADDACLIRSEVERCRRILEGMAGRKAVPNGEAPSGVTLSNLLEGVSQRLTDSEPKRVENHILYDKSVVLPVEATQQALTTLVKNAFDSITDDQPVHVYAECRNGNIRFTVEDSGAGMNAETLSRVSEPFFTTKGPGRGIGLGTFLVRTFAESMKGNLIFESAPGIGTKAILEIPLVRSSDV